MTVRQTERYQRTLAELAQQAASHPFQGAGAFFAWERLNTLIARLERAFDAYELEGDMGPAEAAIQAYGQDLARFHLQPLPAVMDVLQRFTADLVTPVLEIETRSVPPVQWPSGYLAVRPEELEAYIQERTSQNSTSF